MYMIEMKYLYFEIPVNGNIVNSIIIVLSVHTIFIDHETP